MSLLGARLRGAFLSASRSGKGSRTPFAMSAVRSEQTVEKKSTTPYPMGLIGTFKAAAAAIDPLR